MVEGDDGRRDSAAEAPELTREPLDGVPPSRRRWPARRALNLASALAALALAIFLIAGGIVRLPGGPSHGIRATPTPAPAQISADAAATVAARDAGNGWLAAGPPEAQTIAFAPSDPATAYTCGVSPTVPAGGSGPIVVEVSYDGGTTWERRPVPATDQACWLSVDPLDAADVALEVTAAPSQPGAPAPTTLYRSFDGGASWAPFAPPPRSTGDLGAIGYYQMAWSGGALFVAPYYIGENGSTRVAVGRGGALAWLDVTALFADTADGASINRLFSTSGSLYVEVNRNVRDCLSDCFKVWRSRDGGATWAAIAPRIAGSEVQVLDAQPDRPVLFGQYDVAADGNSRTYARSEDDGATWTPLPPLPQGSSRRLWSRPRSATPTPRHGASGPSPPECRSASTRCAMRATGRGASSPRTRTASADRSSRGMPVARPSGCGATRRSRRTRARPPASSATRPDDAPGTRVGLSARPAAYTAGMDGIFPIDKAAGMTSHDVVARVRRLAKQKSVGHAGTLDPAAIGVLPVCLGKATRVAEFLSESGKAYRATIRFGVVTDTYDAEGVVVREAPVALDEAAIRAALPAFLGAQMQVPPAYSAIKRGGQPAYKAARAGEAVALDPRPVVISDLRVVSWASPDLVLDVECGKGTYIRSLAYDLGQRLGPGAHLAALVRTRSGPFRLEQCVTLEQLEAALADGSWPDALYAPDEALLDWRAAILGTESERRVLNGMPLRLAARIEGDGPAPDEPLRVYSAGGRFLGILRWDGGQGAWRPDKVLAVEPVGE